MALVYPVGQYAKSLKITSLKKTCHTQWSIQDFLSRGFHFFEQLAWNVVAKPSVTSDIEAFFPSL